MGHAPRDYVPSSTNPPHGDPPNSSVAAVLAGAALAANVGVAAATVVINLPMPRSFRDPLSFVFLLSPVLIPCALLGLAAACARRSGWAAAVVLVASLLVAAIWTALWCVAPVLNTWRQPPGWDTGALTGLLLLFACVATAWALAIGGAVLSGLVAAAHARTTRRAGAASPGRLG